MNRKAAICQDLPGKRAKSHSFRADLLRGKTFGDFNIHEKITKKANYVASNTKVECYYIEKENYEERKETQKGKSFRHVCSIPFFEFQRDPLLKQYLFYSEAKEGDAARRVLR